MNDPQVNTMYEKDWYQTALMEVVGWWAMWSMFALVCGLWLGTQFQADAETDRPTITDQIMVVAE